MSKSSLEAAAEAAARVNAILIAKGKLKLAPSQIKPNIGSIGVGNLKSESENVTAEVDINDAPLMARNLLTRGHIQDEISKSSCAALSTRGRYMTPAERQNNATPECRPLYLNVQGPSFEAVQAAVHKIQDLIDQHSLLSGFPKSPTAGVVTYPTLNLNGGLPTQTLPQTSHISSGSHFVQDKVFIGLEQAPPEYPVREKIMGPAGSFLQHIRTETGAVVTLRGKGSCFIEPTSGREAFEPLYIHLTHPKPEGLQAAKVLAINLVDTAHVEFAQWQQTQNHSIFQPMTSVVLPQTAPVAYQNQVVVTPTVLPGQLPNNARVIVSAAGLTMPSVGTTLTTGITNLVHGNIPAVVQPVSVVSTIPVSVQAIPSPAVITYPTYVANANPVLGRPVGTVITRSTGPILGSTAGPVLAPSASPGNILGMMPSTAVYSMSQQPAVQIQPVMYTNVRPSQPPPLLIGEKQIPQQFTRPPPSIVKGYYDPSTLPSRRLPPMCLQESNSNPPTELPPLQQRRDRAPRAAVTAPSRDRDLMPPPPPTIIAKRKEPSFKVPHIPQNEPKVKKLKGALLGIAGYGSDDSEDEDQ